MRLLSLLLVAVTSFAGVRGLYFHLTETESRCFQEDLPEDTLLIGKYKVEVFDSNQNEFLPASNGLGMHVEVKNPDGKIILSRTYAMEGRFTFTSEESGEHTLCIYSNSSAWFGGVELRVHLDLSTGQDAVDFEAIQRAEQLTDLELRVRSLLELASSVAKEQQYGREREEYFREVSASTNQRALWWFILQTSVLVLVGCWQMHHLQTFFRTKKLV